MSSTRVPGSGDDGETYDVLGVGLGPFNLSLAALADGMPGLRAVFLEQKPAFSWHPGLLLEGTTLQVPFLADLVTLIDPTSPWSFLAYLREHNRLFRFYFYERFHIPRREYEDYCAWVAHRLPSTRFSTRVEAVRWHQDAGVFRVAVRSDGSPRGTVLTARHLVLGVGTEPAVPPAFAGLAGGSGGRILHSAEYLDRRAGLRAAGHVTVVGSGQSGAEVFADLLRGQAETGQGLSWITRTPAFAPMEYSKLGLEQFTADFVTYFHGLDQAVKDEILPSQWQLYKGIDADTIAEIYDLLYERTVGGAEVDATLLPNVTVEDASLARDGTIRLGCRHRDQNRTFSVETAAVVLATGYTPRRPELLDPVAGLLDLDETGRFKVDARYRVTTTSQVTGRIYVQNAELHTHGVGAPDLGLGAWRAAVILDDLTGGQAHPLPEPSAFTTFGVPRQTPERRHPTGDAGRAGPEGDSRTGCRSGPRSSRPVRPAPVGPGR